MARSLFTGRGGDFAIQDPAGNSGVVKTAANLTQTGTFWSARTGGTQYTDLRDGLGNPISGLSTNASGYIVTFQGPDSVTVGWADFGGPRILLEASDGSAGTSPGQLDTVTAANLANVTSATRVSVNGIIAASAATERATSNTTYGRVETPELHGGVGDGVTDDTAAVNAAIAAAMAVGGAGTVRLSDKTYRCNGAIVLPYTGTSTAPKQRPCRIAGNGGFTTDGTWLPSPVNGGPVLDLRYDGTDTLHPAKIDTRGAGFLELDHLTIVSGGTDDFPIFQTTNTTVEIHHVGVIGNAAKIGVACVQDAFVLGGTTIVVGNGPNAPFQGYGSRVHDNYFGHIRRGFLGQSYCNNVSVENNTFSTSCGSSTGGAIEWHGFVGGESDSGALTRGNTIEVNRYKYGVAVYNTNNSNFGPDGYYDPTVDHTGAIFVDATSAYNYAIAGYNNDTYPFVIDPGKTTTVVTSHQGQTSTIRQKIRYEIMDGPVIYTNTVGSVEVCTNSDVRSLLWRNPVGTAQGAFIDWGKTWTADGVGSTMKQDSGTGGSYFDHVNYAVRFYDQNAGPLRMRVGAGKDGFDLGAASDATVQRAAAGVVNVGKLAVTNTAAATTPGTVVKKMEVFDAAGASLGFVAIYGAIT